MKTLIRIWLVFAMALITMPGISWGAAPDFKGTLNGYSFANPGPLAAPTELTLNAAGAITVTQTLHTVDTEADAASDDLITINGGAAGQIIYLRAAHTDRTVVLKETGNISIPYGSQISLDTTAFWVQLNYDADLSKWVVVGALPDVVSLNAFDMTNGTSIPQPIAATASKPATCTQGQKWQDSTTGADWSCTATNTWTRLVTYVASGTSTLGTDAIASGNHATLVTTSATGVATTDIINWGFNTDIHGITGYAPATTGMLTIIAYPTADNVNFLVVNNTGASITPGSAVTLNWQVIR